MSNYSGKCDLYDDISFSKQYDCGNVYVSDELECFNEFKKKTGGVMYQNFKVVVSEHNQDWVKEHCRFFDYTAVIKEVEDKRVKGGKRNVTTYTYKYYGVDYANLKELNKHGVYCVREIRFNTLLDIIPYYPYIVAMSMNDGKHQIVYLSDESFVDSQFKRSCKDGWIPLMHDYYKNELQKHYIEVCKNYFMYKLDERTREETVSRFELEKCGDDYYFIALDRVDYMHEVEWVFPDRKGIPHWTSPVFVEGNKIKLSGKDVDGYLKDYINNGQIKLRYVADCDFPNEAKDRYEEYQKAHPKNEVKND